MESVLGRCARRALPTFRGTGEMCTLGVKYQAAAGLSNDEATIDLIMSRNHLKLILSVGSVLGRCTRRPLN